jgi:hypothetical protein
MSRRWSRVETGSLVSNTEMLSRQTDGESKVQEQGLAGDIKFGSRQHVDGI